MGIWTLLVMLLLVFQVKYAEAQVSAVFEARSNSFKSIASPAATSSNDLHSSSVSPVLSQRCIIPTRVNYLPLAHYKSAEWPTLSMRYCSNTGDDWLYEHNMVVVKSLVQIANRLMVGINCHYNWCFTIAGNGAGMMLNKFPIKIYFAGVMGDAPNLCHR